MSTGRWVLKIIRHLLDDSTGASRNLVFLRVNELNGDQTIIGNPLTVLTSLAEHEYIHVAQSRNNPDLAEMVWTDKDYQYFIEGYANIGNVSSQRYYFETQDAIVDAAEPGLDESQRGTASPYRSWRWRHRGRVCRNFSPQIHRFMTAISKPSSCGWVGRLMWMVYSRGRSARICSSPGRAVGI